MIFFHHVSVNFREFFAVVCENVTPFVHSLIPIVFVYLTQAETNRLLLTGVPRYTPAHALCQVSSYLINLTGFFTEIQPALDQQSSFAALL